MRGWVAQLIIIALGVLLAVLILEHVGISFH